MNHTDHVNLLHDGVPQNLGGNKAQVWADLGSGTGAFTLALADLLGPSATIYSVDRDDGSLREQQRAMQTRFPQVQLNYLTANFTQPLDLPPLDGIVMANSLHFLTDKQKEAALPAIKSYVRPGGRLILVEYGTDHGNTWVPYPLSYPTWERLAGRMGLQQTRLLATVPSRFLGTIYSAVSIV